MPTLPTSADGACILAGTKWPGGICIKGALGSGLFCVHGPMGHRHTQPRSSLAASVSGVWPLLRPFPHGMRTLAAAQQVSPYPALILWFGKNTWDADACSRAAGSLRSVSKDPRDVKGCSRAAGESMLRSSVPPRMWGVVFAFTRVFLSKSDRLSMDSGKLDSGKLCCMWSWPCPPSPPSWMQGVFSLPVQLLALSCPASLVDAGSVSTAFVVFCRCPARPAPPPKHALWGLMNRKGVIEGELRGILTDP
eukprot:1001622-Pelagomonas_calceolata.AAC.4